MLSDFNQHKNLIKMWNRLFYLLAMLVSVFVEIELNLKKIYDVMWCAFCKNSCRPFNFCSRNECDLSPFAICLFIEREREKKINYITLSCLDHFLLLCLFLKYISGCGKQSSYTFFIRNIYIKNTRNFDVGELLKTHFWNIA